LDIAQRLNLLSLMQPREGISVDGINALFAGGQPSSIGLSEQTAFRHFLVSLRSQANTATATTFDATVNNHTHLLNEAETVLRSLASRGVSGQGRDFLDIVSANRGALEVLLETRGAMLRRYWDTI
ncbi:MAG: hypothetical protein NT023_07580, partial [Armatimonadetes bacterium]|nr:hypothetical protein [Armatimonadota bacterium]